MREGKNSNGADRGIHWGGNETNKREEENEPCSPPPRAGRSATRWTLLAEVEKAKGTPTAVIPKGE